MELEAQLKEFTEKTTKLWEDYKVAVDGKFDKLTGMIKPEVKATIDKMEKDFGEYETKSAEIHKAIEARDADYKAMEKKIAGMEAALQHPVGGGSASKLERKDFVTQGLYDMAIEKDADKKAEATWAALRDPRRLNEEQKAMTFNDPETGGYLGPPEYVNEVIKELREITDVMSIAKVRTTSASSMVFPKKTGTITALRRGESETKTATTGLTFGTEQITLPEMYAFDDISEQDLEDSMFNLESEIREEFIDAFAALLGDEFFNGVGPLELEGLLTNGDIGSTDSGDASLIKADTLITFVESALKKQYKVNGVLIFNLATLAAIRNLTETGQGFIWAPGLADAVPNTVAGKRYIISEDAPSVAGGAFPIFYGDFKKGYQVGLRVRLAIKRIVDSTLDAAGNVRFSGRMRVGGKVVQAAAIKKYKISA